MRTSCVSWRIIGVLTCGLAALGGCAGAPPAAPAEVVITEMSPAELPEAVTRAIAAERTGFTPLEVQKKARDGRVYYDVEGQMPDGSEIEFDVLLTSQGADVVEIQRDLAFADIPQAVQAEALAASGGAMPARVIESGQTDGAGIYEFFAEGQPADPAFEIRLRAGQVERLSERWVH